MLSKFVLVLGLFFITQGFAEQKPLVSVKILMENAQSWNGMVSNEIRNCNYFNNKVEVTSSVLGKRGLKKSVFPLSKVITNDGFKNLVLVSRYLDKKNSSKLKAPRGSKIIEEISIEGQNGSKRVAISYKRSKQAEPETSLNPVFESSTQDAFMAASMFYSSFSLDCVSHSIFKK